MYQPAYIKDEAPSPHYKLWRLEVEVGMPSLVKQPVKFYFQSFDKTLWSNSGRFHKKCGRGIKFKIQNGEQKGYERVNIEITKIHY